MDFNLEPARQVIVNRVREYVDREIVPLEPAFLESGFAALLPVLRTRRADVKKQGLWGPVYPREHGGLGLDLLTYGLVSEALGRSPLAHYVFGANAPDAGNVELLHEAATPPQKKQWLDPLVSGEIRSCFAMTEPDSSGANPLMMTTRAQCDGDGWVLDGRKWFATGADGASLCIVMAVSDPGAAPRERTSLFLVPTDAPGYRLLRNIPVMGHTGADLFSHGEVAFEHCRVPATALLGKRGEGFRLAQARLGPGRIHHCMRWLGICDRAQEMMIARAATRVIGPDARRLGDSDIVRAWIAECAAEISAARLLVLHTAWRILHAGARAVRADISMIKFHVAAVLQRVLDRALQVHGGLGVTDDTLLAWFYREERAARIYDGPDEVHKIAVAKRLLEPRSG
ncbi:MAG: acyl-CoA dehydrogenase family protein [Steroidobacteraceae bacterium]